MSGNRLIYPLAVASTAATLLLIFMGGLVTSHGAGMSVPDWPNSYGYNMFAFPISQWRGGIFYEHTHRLMASVVGCASLLMFLHAWGFGKNAKTVRNLIGILVIAAGAVPVCCGVAAFGLRQTAGVRPVLLEIAQAMMLLAGVFGYAIFCKRPDGRPFIRGLTLAVLVGVIFQGMLGGFRVVLVELGLAIVHACVAQAFLCLVALLALMSARRWSSFHAIAHLPMGLVRLIAITTVAIYGQLIAGALMRHHQAGLAIPDLPLAYHHWLPPMSAGELEDANSQRGFGEFGAPLPPVTLGQIWLHFVHRCGAVLVTILICTTAVWILMKIESSTLRRLAWTLMGLLTTQLTLGVLTVLWRKPADIASTHVAVGAATLMTTFILFVRARQMMLPSTRAAAASPHFPLNLSPVSA